MYRLQCFGAAVVKAADGQEIHFRSRKHLALLLYLVAHPHRAHGREDLAALLWDSDEALARHSLSQALYDIRRRLRPVELQARRGMLSLQEGDLEYEGAALEEAVRTGELARVPGLFRGGFAPNLERLSPRFDRWLESERSRYRTIAQMALRHYAEECDRQGRWGEMCLTALRLVRLDPLDEAAHRALMRALWLHGDQQSALRHYSEVEEFLVRELPEGISEQTTELVQRIRSSRPPLCDAGRDVREEPPLIGREREFERLRSAMEALRTGEGGLVIVRGEAGIGKTRLLQELVRVAPMEGIVRLSSRCYSAERDVSYGPIVDGIEPLAEVRARAAGSNGKRYYQLGHLFPDLFEPSLEHDPQGIDAGIRRRRLYEEVADILRQSCREQPILWIIEDIQWIDASSASLLHYVARRLSRKPLLLMASLRTEDEVGDAVRPLVEGEGTPLQPTFLQLAPLPMKAVRELIRHANPMADNAPMVQLVERFSGGNPFYALEILRAAESMEEADGPGLPTKCLSERLRHVLAARLRGISQPALRVLEAIAILERHASLKNVAALTGTGVADLSACIEELERRGLMEQKSTRLAFRHDLLREFVYHNQASFRRAALHLASAELLARRGDVRPATLAMHFSRGGDDARTYEFALRAVDQATEACAHSEAERLAAIAVEAATTPETRASARLLLAKASRAAGNFHKAAALLEELQQLPELPSGEKLRLLLELAQTRLDLGQSKAALSAAQLASQLLSLSEAPSRSLHLQVLASRLKCAVLANEAAIATSTFSELPDLHCNGDSVSLDSATLALVIVSQTLYATYFKSSAFAISLFDNATPIVSSVPYALGHRLRVAKAAVQYRLGQLRAAAATIDHALHVSREANDVYGVANLTNNLACVALESGDWRLAREHCQQALSMYETLYIDKQSGLPALLNLGNAAFYEGDLRKARRIFEVGLANAQDGGFPYWIVQLNASLGLVALQLGDDETPPQRWQQLQSTTSASELEGMEDRFMYEWFDVYMKMAYEHEDPQKCVDRLRKRACEENERDRITSSKLIVLAEVFRDTWGLAGYTDLPLDREEHLEVYDVAWFERFARRWFRTVTRRLAHTGT